MKKTTRIVCLIMAALMLLSTIIAFITYLF